MSDEILEAEVVNPKNLPVKKEETKKPVKKGKLSLKYKTVAEFAARGYPVEIIAQRVNMTVSNIYRILETNELVWQEMNIIQKRIFAEEDRFLRRLRDKALKKLEQRLDDPDTEADAILKILTTTGKTTEKGKPQIVQFFGGGQGGGPIEQTIDQIILQRRKERGLDGAKLEKPSEPDELEPAPEDMEE